MTAEELIDEKYVDFEALNRGNIWVNIEELMIEFAKIHVQKALEKAYENTEYFTEYDGRDNRCLVTIDENSILNAYTLENIK